MAGRHEHFVPAPDPVVVRTQKFIARHWSDAAGADEVRADLGSGRYSHRGLAANLADLRTMLDSPDHAWRLLWLVEIDGNVGLGGGTAPGTEAQARAFLEDFAAMVGAAVEAMRPPRGAASPGRAGAASSR